VHRGSPVAASRFRAWISKLFNFAVKAQLCSDNPARLTENPIDAKARQRKRKLDDRELALVWKAADQLDYPFGTAVQLLILTGQRRDEVCAMPRRELDLGGKLWVIAPSRAKNSVEHLVPLSSAALALINGLPVVGDGSYLFSTNGRTPVSGFSKMKKQLDAAITELNGGKPLLHWTLHDLRRTFSSGWARLRIPTEVTEKALNHVGGTFGGIVSVYNTHAYEAERAEAMEAWAKHVRSLVRIGKLRVVGH